jgi:DNA replication protein DnaC
MKFKPSESDVKHTFELINMRLIRQDITIITSERSLSEIMGIDEALGSRIKQMCGEFTINIAKKDGRNYRL